MYKRKIRKGKKIVDEDKAMFEVVDDKRFEANLKSLIAFNMAMKSAGKYNRSKKWGNGKVIYP